MVSLTSLLAPIVLSAVLVFVVSSLIHMVLGYHKNDMIGLPNEAGVLDALRPFNIPPGDYGAPHAGSMAAMKDPDYIARMQRGPVFFITVLDPAKTGMGARLVQWFVYSLVVSLFAGYVASRALAPGASYLDVFRFAGATAFCGYSLALLQNTIWYSRNWGMTLRSMFDGLIYAMFTAGAFGWLWPH